MTFETVSTVLLFIRVACEAAPEMEPAASLLMKTVLADGADAAKLAEIDGLLQAMLVKHQTAQGVQIAQAVE